VDLAMAWFGLKLKTPLVLLYFIGVKSNLCNVLAWIETQTPLILLYFIGVK
jgi:hypothetical protein